MVQFTKLRLTGFKSFVDPTELLIEPGLTGIVGPNGCGKSNLVEALRWVMGETSPKRMRGGEMDDVIFGGSGNRPARNIAEVVVTVESDGRALPAQFDGAAVLEVARRIERGSGSLYRVNGRECRARDVQLLFADAASGAHSTALVSQGRVGAIINAKPVERRALLEEAAGITGLHSRRHEAELRLRAAEANLARLDDVIVTLESQLQALKKQARQAIRYRKVNEQLRRVEAVLLHLKWRESAARIAEAGRALAAAGALVAERTAAAAAAGTAQAEAAAALPGLRQAEAEAAAELQRLTLARHGLDQEEARVAAAAAEAARRLEQIEADTGRETALAADADAAEAQLAAETAALAAAAAGERQATAEAAAVVAAAEGAVEAIESALAELTRRIADGEAERDALARREEELAARLARLGRRREELAAERAAAAGRAAEAPARAAGAAAIAAAEAALAEARAAAAAAEEARAAAAAAELAARERLQRDQAQEARLLAEAEALAALLPAAGSPWSPLVDSLAVAPGYEAALGAALGDDLLAAADAAAPLRWEALGEAAAGPPLPAGAEPLARHVQGSPALARRLAQIGVVADEAAGLALRHRLAQGQRLVTREGAMWRWDGFTVAAGTATGAATRLRQRGRLKEIEGALVGARARRLEGEAAMAGAAAAAAAAIAAEREARAALDRAYRELAAAREAEAAAAQEAAAGASRLAALDRAAGDLTTDIAEAEAERGRLGEARDRLPDLAEWRAQAADLRARLGEERARLIEARSAHDRLQREAEARQRRGAAIAEERRSWQGRAEAARRQLAALAERQAAAGAELERLARRPAQIAEQRRSLADHIDAAALRRRAAADRLAEAETRLAEADRRLKAAEAALAAAREDRVRAEAAEAQAVEAGAMLAARIRERLGCAPEEAAALAELAPDAPLPDPAETEARLERLLRERDAIGPVNLRAEAESAELEQQIAGLQTERSDLVAAVARLRQGIASLNREGRERLLAAFELVNGHFGALFTRLFGGGRAHLALTEAEDPLEAGLEIMASPPGKRLQTLSLLSGGEQALTALALLFAVFLTNPAPICVLDEVDAPLDDANVDRFCSLVEELAHGTATRFLVITHHRMTMARMDRLFGVTMAERGISQLVSVDLQTAAELRATA